jgi:hypothetical protein
MKMPPQRTPLGAIDSNRLPYVCLTPHIRGKIIGYVLVGSKPITIALGLNISLDTVKYIISVDPLRHE